LANVEKEIEKVISSQNKFLDLVEKLFMGRKKVELKFNKILIKSREDEIIPLSALSAGEKQILILLLVVLIIGENTILIDEPELSLHVNWQSEIIDDFKILNPEMQLIIASHSPEIMANVPENKIFRLP
jgi:energy-coupling factor transporter ATP-binding protein EcfA2